MKKAFSKVDFNLNKLGFGTAYDHQKAGSQEFVAKIRC